VVCYDKQVPFHDKNKDGVWLRIVVEVWLRIAVEVWLRIVVGVC
jgi:hypothetical protein